MGAGEPSAACNGMHNKGTGGLLWQGRVGQRVWGGSAPLSRIARHYRRNERAIGRRGCPSVGLPSKRYSRTHLGSTRFCSPAVILALTILSPTWAQINTVEGGETKG